MHCYGPLHDKATEMITKAYQCEDVLFPHVNGLVQDYSYSISIANALETLQSCTKPLMCTCVGISIIEIESMARLKQPQDVSNGVMPQSCTKPLRWSHSYLIFIMRIFVQLIFIMHVMGLYLKRWSVDGLKITYFENTATYHRVKWIKSSTAQKPSNHGSVKLC